MVRARRGRPLLVRIAGGTAEGQDPCYGETELAGGLCLALCLTTDGENALGTLEGAKTH